MEKTCIFKHLSTHLSHGEQGLNESNNKSQSNKSQSGHTHHKRRGGMYGGRSSYHNKNLESNNRTKNGNQSNATIARGIDTLRGSVG